MDEDSKGQRKLEDSGGGLLPAVEGHSLEKNRIEYSQELHGDRQSYNNVSGSAIPDLLSVYRQADSVL